MQATFETCLQESHCNNLKYGWSYVLVLIELMDICSVQMR
jgi:hypothetical protein